MFTFNRGSWEDGSPLPEWEDGEDSDGYLRRISFTGERTLFGHQHGGNLEIYESSDGESFFAFVCPSGGRVFEVYLPDFPSFMMFIRDHAGVFAAESTNVTQEQTYALLQKLFQVQHGHAADRICPECDPEEWKAREERLSKQKC